MQKLLKVIQSTRLVTLDDRLNLQNNSIDIMRILLSLFVIYSHTFPVLYGLGAGPNGEVDMLASFTHGQISFGSLAVYSFFIISGFLVTQSIMNSKTLFEYSAKRILRLVPALFCSLLLTAFIIGPLVTSHSFMDYLTVQDGNPFKYFWYNLTFGIFGFYYSISDVFLHNALPSSINASMWTLPMEFACYVLLTILSMYQVLKKRRLFLHVYLASLLLAYLGIRSNYIPVSLENSHWWILNVQFISGFIKLSYFFLAGSIMYCYKDKIVYSKTIFAIIVICLYALTRSGHLSAALLILLPYTVIFICFLKPLINIRKIGDYSYGLYIYAFPIQQLLAHFLSNGISFIMFFIISTVCILLVSIPSWFFVEKPALKIKKKLAFVKGFQRETTSA